MIYGYGWLNRQPLRSFNQVSGDTDYISDECGLDIRSFFAVQIFSQIVEDYTDAAEVAVRYADDLVEELNISYQMDGNMWCATRPGFINLQESIAGFGPTKREANSDLKRNEAKEVTA